MFWMARAADGRHALRWGIAGEATSTSITLATTRASRVPTPSETTMRHNARQQRAQVLSMSLASVPKLRGLLIAKNARFSAESVEGGGLKNRRLRQCKISIREVLISVTLSVRGEVAEWPKAAVC
jgi:hypothetical protein